MDAAAVVSAYFKAWQESDPAALRDLLAPDVSVKGPLGAVDGAEGYREALSRLYGITRRLEVKGQWIDAGDVITWFDLHHTGAEEPMPSVNWIRVAGGLITRVRVAFDPRPILSLMSRGG